MRLFSRNPKEYIADGMLGHSLDSDWTFWDIKDVLKDNEIPKLKDPKSTVNQWLHSTTKSSCTITNAYIQICQIFDRQANTEELLEVVARCHDNMWYNYKWQYSSTGANMATKRWNSQNPKDKIYYFTIEPDTDEYKTFVLDNNFLVGASYRGNSKYNNDYRPDGVLDATSFWASTYWHRTNIKSFSWKVGVFDSYYGWKRNKYLLWREWDHIVDLIKSGVFYPTFYVFMKESWSKKKVDQIKDSIKSKRIATIFANAGSLYWEYLGTSGRKQLSSMVNKARAKYTVTQQTEEEKKLFAILISTLWEVGSKLWDKEKKIIIDYLIK